MKWFCAAAAVATALSQYPFLAGESIEFRWWWYGFEAVAEQETEILPEQLEEIGRRMKEAHPQSTMAKPIPCAFVYNGETYILSPELGVLFLPRSEERRGGKECL